MMLSLGSKNDGGVEGWSGDDTETSRPSQSPEREEGDAMRAEAPNTLFPRPPPTSVLVSCSSTMRPSTTSSNVKKEEAVSTARTCRPRSGPPSFSVSAPPDTAAAPKLRPVTSAGTKSTSTLGDGTSASSRISSASQRRTTSAKARRIADGSAALWALEQYPLMPPLPSARTGSAATYASTELGTAGDDTAPAEHMKLALHERDVLQQHMARAARREFTNLPPCTPGRVISSPRTQRAQRSPSVSSASTVSSHAQTWQRNPPRLTPPTFVDRRAHFHDGSGLKVGLAVSTSGSLPLPVSSVDEFASKASGVPRSDGLPSDDLMRLVDAACEALRQSGMARADSSCDHDPVKRFDGVLISQSQHEAFVKEALVEIATRWYEEVLPEAKRQAELDAEREVCAGLCKAPTVPNPTALEKANSRDLSSPFRKWQSRSPNSSRHETQTTSEEPLSPRSPISDETIRSRPIDSTNARPHPSSLDTAPYVMLTFQRPSGTVDAAGGSNEATIPPISTAEGMMAGDMSFFSSLAASGIGGPIPAVGSSPKKTPNSLSSPNKPNPQISKLKLDIAKLRRQVEEIRHSADLDGGVHHRAESTSMTSSTKGINSSLGMAASHRTGTSDAAERSLRSGMTVDDPFAVKREFHTDLDRVLGKRGDEVDTDEIATAYVPAVATRKSVDDTANHHQSVEQVAKSAVSVQQAAASFLSPLERLQRTVRFRQQATFVLRRKLKALLEKKRPESRLIKSMRLEGDREALSLNVVGSSAASSGAAAGIANVPTPPADDARASVSSPAPTVASTVAPRGAAPPAPTEKKGPASLEPVLSSLLSHEVPPSARDSLAHIEQLYIEYQELIQSVRKAHQHVQVFTKGTIDEKRRLLVELGMRLPDKESEPAAEDTKKDGRRGSLSALFRGVTRRASRVRRNKASGSIRRKSATGPNSPLRVVFSDSGVQPTITEEMLLFLHHRLQGLVKHDAAFRVMWGSMHVALRNIVRMWDDIEVDLSCTRCEKLLQDAMIISPCGTTVCRRCLRDDDEHTFDSREREDCACQDHDGSIPNALMRRFCKAFAVREVTGAITPVPSEGLLQDLEYQLSGVAHTTGLSRGDPSASASTKAPPMNSPPNSPQRASKANQSPNPSGGILVASSKLGGASRRQSKVPRRKSVVFAAADGRDGDEAELLTPPSKMIPAPSTGKDDDPTAHLTGLPLAIHEAGLWAFVEAFSDASIQFSTKKIAHGFTTQFRR